MRTVGIKLKSVLQSTGFYFTHTPLWQVKRAAGRVWTPQIRLAFMLRSKAFFLGFIPASPAL